MSYKPPSNMPPSNMPQGNMPQGNMPQGNMPQGNMAQGNMPQAGMPPSSMTAKPNYADPTAPGNYASAMAAKKKGGLSFPIGFSAGGGLAVGILAGLLLISGGGDASEAVASNDDPTEVAEKAGDDDAEANGEDDTPAEAETKPEGEGTEAAAEGAVEVKPEAATDPVAEVVPEPEVEPEVVPEPEAEPEPIVAQLTFVVSPAEALPLVSIKVDGEPSSADSLSLEFAPKKTSKRIKVVAEAEGYATFRRTYNVKGDQDLAIRLRKPAPAGSKTGKGKGKGKGKKPGNLISL